MRADDDVPRMCEGVGGPCEGMGVCRLGLPAAGGIPRSGYHPRSISSCSLAKPMLADARPRLLDWTDERSGRFGPEGQKNTLWRKWLRPIQNGPAAFGAGTRTHVVCNLPKYEESMLEKRSFNFGYDARFSVLQLVLLRAARSVVLLAQGPEAQLGTSAAALQRLFG